MLGLNICPNSSFNQSTCVHLQLQSNTNIYVMGNCHQWLHNYVNALVFIMFLSTSLYATPYYSMCITKMYDMLNKNSLGLLKKGAAKQSRIKRIEAPVRARAQPVVK